MFAPVSEYFRLRCNIQYSFYQFLVIYSQAFNILKLEDHLLRMRTYNGKKSKKEKYHFPNHSHTTHSISFFWINTLLIL